MSFANFAILLSKDFDISKGVTEKDVGKIL